MIGQTVRGLPVLDFIPIIMEIILDYKTEVKGLLMKITSLLMCFLRVPNYSRTYL
jgi:hypothetical protein